MDNTDEVVLHYKKGRGLVDIYQVEDLEVDQEAIFNLKERVIKVFNKEAKTMEVNRLGILFIPAGIIGIIVAYFFIQYPFKYMAISFGVFLLPIFPIYVCCKKKLKDKKIKNFIQNVDVETDGKLCATTYNKHKIQYSRTNDKLVFEFNGFSIYVNNEINKKRMSGIPYKSKLKKLNKPRRNYPRRKKNKENVISSNNTTNQSGSNSRLEKTKDQQKRSSISKGYIMVQSKSIHPVLSKQPSRPISQRLIHDEPKFPDKEDNLELPKKVEINTDSEKEIEVDIKNLKFNEYQESENNQIQVKENQKYEQAIKVNIGNDSKN
jgi:hypothetical protein